MSGLAEGHIHEGEHWLVSEWEGGELLHHIEHPPECDTAYDEPPRCGVRFQEEGCGIEFSVTYSGNTMPTEAGRVPIAAWARSTYIPMVGTEYDGGLYLPPRIESPESEKEKNDG